VKQHVSRCCHMYTVLFRCHCHRHNEV